MKRWILNILAGLSLTLAVAVAGLWVRSYWRHDSGLGSAMEINWGVSSLNGKCAAVWITHSAYREKLKFWTYRAYPRDFAVDCQWHWGGFGVLSRAYDALDPKAGWGRSVVAPYWFLGLLLLVAPALWLRQARRRWLLTKREKLGLCVNCGYDLRASKERCPECGEPIAVEGVKGTS